MTMTVSPLNIVYATRWFGQTKFPDPLTFEEKDCPIPDGYQIVGNSTLDLTEGESDIDIPWCTITSSKDNLQNAVALIFHAIDFPVRNLPEHIPNQPWILESLETPFSSPYRADPEDELIHQFDHLASYNLRSSFLFSYFSPSIMDVANRPLPKDFMRTKTKTAPVLWIARNCHASSGRQKYIEKLMQYVDVHSYGSCLNNKPFPEQKSRLQLMKEYKFYLAMENANCEDYVTEKLFDTLSQSAVPIVDGPSRYEGFLPTQRSAIFVDAYPDPKDLADYINYLDKNDTAYLEYLAFRRDALDKPARDRLDKKFIDNWGDTMEFNEKSSYCSVCRGVLPSWAKRHDPAATIKSANKTSIKETVTETLSEKNEQVAESDVFIVDDTCEARGKWDYIEMDPPYQPTWTPRPRDEFTRPHFFDNFTFTPTDTIKESFFEDSSSGSSIETNHRHLYTVSSIFIIFIFAFMSYLYRESRRHRSSKSYHTLHSPVHSNTSDSALMQVAPAVV